MKAEQAKAAVTEAILGGVHQMTSVLADSCLTDNAEEREQATRTFESGLAHLRQMEAVAHRIIDRVYMAEKARPPVSIEGDQEFRKRVQLAAGPASVNAARLERAEGAALDEIAGFYGLKRK